MLALSASPARPQDGAAPATPPQDPAPPVPRVPGPKTPDAPRRIAFAGTADDLAAKFPGVVRVADYGRSAGGAPLRIATVTSSRDADVTWSALVVARLSGLCPAEATPLAIDVAARLAERAAEIPPGVAFRFIPDASPDAGGATGRAGNATPTDEDQDGDVDEDGPDDLDGDGRVTWMRVPDLAGAFGDEDAAKPHEGPRRADPAKGVLAKWRIVREGRDDDADGVLNEDGPGGPDVARNFASSFEEHTPLAGRWAVSEPETRAMMDLLLADERIAVVYELGASETLAAAPEWGGAWPKLPDDDAKLLEGLRATHGKGAVEKRKARAPGNGSLGAVCWHQLGRLRLGRAPLAREAPPWPLAGAETVNWTFVWKAVAGAGVPAGAEVLHAGPPAANAAANAAHVPGVADETDSVAEFLLVLAKERAQIAFTRTQTSGEPGVLRIETRLANSGRLPTHTQRGADVRGRRPLNVRVAVPDGAALVAGKPLVQVERLAGGAESGAMRWVVSGPTGTTVRVSCTGPDTGTTTLEVQIP